MGSESRHHGSGHRHRPLKSGGPSSLVFCRSWGHAVDVRRQVALGISSVVLALFIAGCSGGPRQASQQSPSITSPSSTTTTSVTTKVSQPSGSTTGLTPESSISPSPTVTIAGWTGREPATVYFSGDAGNVATGLTWAVWNQSEAVGHGTRQELSCIPDCADGTATPYPVTLTLTKPVDGKFTSIIEQTADGKGTTETFTAPFGQGACTSSDESSCIFS